MVAILLLMTLMAGLLLVMLRRLRHLQNGQQARDRQLSVLFEDSAAQSACVARIGTHLAKLDEQLQRIIDRQERSGLHESMEREYEQAIKMVASGESVEQIMAECGLVRSEVELMQRVNVNEDAPDDVLWVKGEGRDVG